MRQHSGGFTLIEILIVVGALAILASIVILAINPSKQLAEARNTERRLDVNTVLNAVYQYAIDNEVLPPSITTTPTEICRTGAGSCAGLIDLSVLEAGELYLVDLPNDPTGASTNGTGYVIVKSANDRVTVSAPSAELGASISVTR